MTWQSDIDNELKKRLGNKYVAPTVAKSAGLNKEEIDKEIKQRMESIKAKPSQVAREEQQIKTEEQKPSFIQKVKTGITKIGEVLSGKKKIEQQVQQTQQQTQQDQTLLQKVSTAQINQQKLKQNILDDQINKMKSFDSVTSAGLSTEAKKKAEEIMQPVFNEAKRLEDKSKTTETIDWRDTIYDIVKNPEKVTPFGDVAEIPEIYKLVTASDRLKKGEATIEDAKMLQEWLEQEQRDRTFGSKVISGITQSLKFGAELYLTAGSYTLGKEAAKKGIKYLMTKAGKEATEEALKKFGYKVAAGVVGETVRTAAMAPIKVTKGALENQLVSNLEKVSGVTDTEESVTKSVTKSFLSNWVENVSERGGDALGIVFKGVSDKVKSKLIKNGIYNMITKLAPDKASVVAKYFQKTGYDGFINEFLEERIGQVTNGLLYEIGLSNEEFKMLSPEDLLVEVTTLSVPGIVSKVSDVITTKLDKIDANTIKMTPDAARDTVNLSNLSGTPAGDEILKAADVADKDGKMVLVDLKGNTGNKTETTEKNIIGVSVSEEKVAQQKESQVTQEKDVTSPEALELKKQELMKKVSVGKQGETIKTEETTKKLTNEEITQLKELAKASNTAKSFLDKIGPVNAQKIKSSGDTIIGFYNNANQPIKTGERTELKELVKDIDNQIKKFGGAEILNNKSYLYYDEVKALTDRKNGILDAINLIESAETKFKPSPIKTGEIEPITAYHGSDIKFDNFDLNKVGTNTDSGMFGKGIYFSGNKKEAATYARKTGNVNEYQLNLKNPYIIRSQADIPNIQATGTKDYSEKFTKYLQDRGYDGVIDEISPNKQYVVFDPKQITSPIKTEKKEVAEVKKVLSKEKSSEEERQAEEYLNKRSVKFRTDIKTSDELGVKGKTKQEIKELIVQHNLSEESLLYANKMGGLAVPSIAISAKETPLESFGEITLLGNKELITPSPTSKVYGADIYSPRYPRITYTPNKNAKEYLEPIFDKASEKIDDLMPVESYLDYFKESGRRGIEDSRTTKELFYVENNKNVPSDRYELRENAYKYTENNNYEYQNYVNEIVKNISGTEEIFLGYSNSGQRRYKAHTLENVVNIMKKELVDTEGFNYGVSNIRANLAKRFKSIKEIQANRNVIVSKDEMDEFKSYIEDKFDKIVEKAIDVYTGQATYPNDTFTQIIRDGIKNNDLQKELNEYGFEKVDYKELSDFLTELKQAPTEYFEAKLKRAVDLGEFEAAIVPDNVSKETLNILESKGIDVYKYSNEDNRSDIVKFVAEKRKIAFRLADDFEKSTGIKLSNDQEQKIIELNKQIFGDEDIRITAQILTPDGQKALGSYRDRMIDILDGQANAVDTYYHEAVHKYFDLFTTKEEQIKLLVEAKNTFNTKDFAEAEEMLAENFINYVKTRETKLENSKGIFEKIISRIKQFFDNETNITKFYEEIIQGKAKTKKTTSEKVNTAKNITQIKSALKSVKNKIDNILSDVEGRATVAQELRSGLNTKDIATLKLAWNRNQKFQEGDLETIRNSNYFELVNRVVEDVQIKYPEKSDDEAYEFALNLPTKAEEKGIKPEELKQLIKRQKILSSYLDTLKRKQTQITGEEEIKRGDEIYKEWTSVLESQEKLNKLITSQQRIEAAQRPVEEGTGKPKLSKVAQRVLDKLVDVKDYDVTYQPMNIVEDAAKAAEFVDQNPELSLKIAKGLELPPPDITETAISIAAAQKALDNKDYLLYTRLILSRTFRQTRRGQEIVAERGRQDENSTEFFIKKLLEERARLVTKGKTWLFEKEKSVQKIIAKEVQKVKTDMDKKVLRKLESAQKLIDSLTCKI